MGKTEIERRVVQLLYVFGFVNVSLQNETLIWFRGLSEPHFGTENN